MILQLSIAERGMKTRSCLLSHSVFCMGVSLLLFTVSCQSKPPAPLQVDDSSEETSGSPFFEDITTASGVDFTYCNGEETADHVAILESLGGGVALIDYDGDNQLDLFLVGGGFYTGEDKRTIAGYPCKLFKNLGHNRFQDVTAEVGLDHRGGGQPWFYSHGAAVADYDRDGWPDMLVTGWGHVALFHNVPVDASNPARGRRFVDATIEAGLDKGITWATSAAFGDLDGDGYPDLYICQYVNWSFANNLHCGDGKTIDICPPKNFDGLPHKLYRNTGKGRFVDVSDTAGLVAPGRDSCKGLSVLMVDLNGDGKPDLYVTNDTVAKLLYMNHSTPGKIRLQEIGMTSGTALDEHGNANGSMGVDAADYDGSGKPSLWVTNYEHELHGLYRNDIRLDRIAFHFQTTLAGLAVRGQKYVGWGTGFVDVDNDGWEDLFVSNGHVMRYHHGNGMNREQPPLLFGNRGGRFLDISQRIDSYGRKNHLGRGVAFGDLDNDGCCDLVVCHQNEPVAILRGIGGAGHHWLGVHLYGKNHADLVGAKAELQVGDRTLTRFVKGGGSYLSSSDCRLLFGLGDETKLGQLIVTWPNGSKQHFKNLPSDCYHHVRQGVERTGPSGPPTG